MSERSYYGFRHFSLLNDPYAFERQAVKAAVEAGVTEVRVVGGSMEPDELAEGGDVSAIEHRLHWHQPDAQPPERVTFWRGGVRSELPRWEQEYVRVEQLQAAVDQFEALVDACGHWIAAGEPPNEQSVEVARTFVRRLRRGQ